MDGLPAELLLGRGDRPPPADLVAAMPFTHRLLATGKGVGFHAKAAPPTVTMPRLKVNMSVYRKLSVIQLNEHIFGSEKQWLVSLY